MLALPADWNGDTMRIRVMGSGLLAVIIGCCEVASSTPAPNILKVDPNPVEKSKSTTIVYSITNTTAADITVQVQLLGQAATPFSYVSVPANGIKVLTWDTTFTTVGLRPVTLRVWEPVGMRLERGCPTCPPRRVTQYGNVVTVSGSVRVYDPVTPPVQPRVSDIGPPGVTGALGGNSQAGVMAALRGSVARLYAVSKHAGVWISENGGMWRQLSASPRHAAVIDVDPTDVRHVIVGERADDKPPNADILTGEAGVWESRDGGGFWQRIYDPGLDPDHPSAMRTGGIRAAAFGPYGKAIVIATSYGIGIRHATLSPTLEPFIFPSSARGDILEIAVSENGVWAWTQDRRLLRWQLDANGWRDLDWRSDPATWPTWESFPLQPTVTVSMADENDARTADNVLTTCAGNCAPTGLAAFDNRAFLVFSPQVAPTHPNAALDPKCAQPVTPATPPNCDAFKNRLGLLTMTVREDPSGARIVSWQGQLLRDNNGTGLGGRLFAYATQLKCSSLPAEVGRGLRLYVGSAQGLEEALAMDSSGRFTWTNPVGSGGYGAVERNNWDGPFPGTTPGIHSDYWGMYVDASVCPPGQFALWLANDGGIYRASIGDSSGGGTHPNPSFEGALSGLDWSNYNFGLHTHNVHSVGLAKASGKAFPSILYATGDNDGWWSEGITTWIGGGSAGDASNALTDGATASGLGLRGYFGCTPRCPCAGGNCAYLTDLSSDNIKTFNVGGHFSKFTSPTVFSFLQTLDSELRANKAVGKLDAVMWVDLPILDGEGGSPISGILGADIKNPRRALIRNRDFASHPDGIGSSFSDWQIERDSLPAGTERFWAADGHAPIYYLYTPNSTACANGLWNQDKSGNWVCLRTGLAFASGSDAPHGPAFANPYDAQQVVWIRLRPAPLVEYTPDGGTTFCALPNLTALVTSSGQLPLTGDANNGIFDPSSRFVDIGSAYHGGPMGRISQIAFDRSRPTTALVVTPSSGVFFGDFELTRLEKRMGIKCKEPRWKAVQPPDANWGYPSTAALLDGLAYVGTEGRGLFQVNAPDSGLAATYFETSASTPLGGKLATLKASDGSAIGWGRYGLRIMGQDGLTQSVAERTGPNGEIMMPASVTPLTSAGAKRHLACELDFLGDGQNAPASVRFDCSLP
jgi:hypothetical protein